MYLWGGLAVEGHCARNMVRIREFWYRFDYPFNMKLSCMFFRHFDLLFWKKTVKFRGRNVQTPIYLKLITYIEDHLKNHYRVYLAVKQIVSWPGIQSSVTTWMEDLSILFEFINKRLHFPFNQQDKVADECGSMKLPVLLNKFLYFWTCLLSWLIKVLTVWLQMHFSFMLLLSTYSLFCFDTDLLFTQVYCEKLKVNNSLSKSSVLSYLEGSRLTALDKFVLHRQIYGQTHWH